MAHARSKSSVIAWWPFDANTKNHSGKIPHSVGIDYDEGANLVLHNVSEAFKVIRFVRLPVIVNLP